MTKNESPFLLVNSASTEITKTSLSALIQHKMQVTKTYPARVSEMVNGVAFVDIFPPIVRQMQEDQPNIASASKLRIHANVRVGDHVLLQAKKGTEQENARGEWTISTTLTVDTYNEKLEQDMQERLLKEGMEQGSDSSKRASKRKLEQWLGLPASESTPWAIPGRMSKGQKLISKKILQWCVNQTGSHFQSRIQEGFPSSKEWGDFEYYFAIFVHAQTDAFTSVVISQDEHKSLVELWADVLKRGKNELRPTMPRESSLPVHQPQPKTPSTPTHVQDRAPVGTALTAYQPTLPVGIQELAKTYHLPLPQGEVPNHLSTLAAWGQSDHPLLKERSTDLFLMMLSEGHMVRGGLEIQQSWNTWHKQTDLVDQLCTVVADGEEMAAVRALAGQQFLNPTMAASVCDQLLLRWRRSLIQKHNLADSALGKPKTPLLDRMEFRRAMRLHGIQCADTWLDQLMLGLHVAPQMGMTLIFVGQPDQSRIIVELLGHILEHATFDHIRLPRNRAHLFGKPSTTGDIYLHSDLTLAIRKGGYQKRYGEIGVWKPHFVWMDNLQPHAKRDGLSLLIQEMYFGEGIQLYEATTHERYTQEFDELSSQNTLSSIEQTRRDELEQFFSPQTLGGMDLEHAWKLRATDNTILIGHLSTTQLDAAPLDLIQRSLVIEVPEFPVDRVRYRLNALNDWQHLQDGLRTLRPKLTWNNFPKTREELFAILDILQGRGLKVNDILAKQVSFLLAAADSWNIPDSSLLTAHICQILLLPRLKGASTEILQSLEELQELPNLAPQLRFSISRLLHAVRTTKSTEAHGLMRSTVT